MKRSIVAAALLGVASTAEALPVITTDATVYGTFATGATVQTFEATGLTPLALTSYANTTNSSIAVPNTAQLGGQITGLHFHSGGGSFNDPIGNPGTPTALLSLQGAIAGDARSPTNVVGPLEINTTNLDLDGFIEIIFTNELQNRVGVWLNPSLGNVVFSVFGDQNNQLESFLAPAGSFVGVERPANEIKFLSIVSATANVGFTVDDLTYGRLVNGGGGGGNGRVPEPGTLALLTLGMLGFAFKRR